MNKYIYFGKEFHPFKGNFNNDIILVANIRDNTLKTIKQFSSIEEARKYINDRTKVI